MTILTPSESFVDNHFIDFTLPNLPSGIYRFQDLFRMSYPAIEMKLWEDVQADDPRLARISPIGKASDDGYLVT